MKSASETPVATAGTIRPKAGVITILGTTAYLAAAALSPTAHADSARESTSTYKTSVHQLPPGHPALYDWPGLRMFETEGTRKQVAPIQVMSEWEATKEVAPRVKAYLRTNDPNYSAAVDGKPITNLRCNASQVNHNGRMMGVSAFHCLECSNANIFASTRDLMSWPLSKVIPDSRVLRVSNLRDDALVGRTVRITGGIEGTSFVITGKAERAENVLNLSQIIKASCGPIDSTVGRFVLKIENADRQRWSGISGSPVIIPETNEQVGVVSLQSDGSDGSQYLVFVWPSGLRRLFGMK